MSLYICVIINACPSLSMNQCRMLPDADDVAVVNDTTCRLQCELNVMSEFGSKYGLIINMSKTKVMIYRNGGRLRTNETVHILQVYWYPVFF